MKITQANLEDLDQLVAIFENYRVFYRKSPDIDGSTAFLKERLTNQDSVIYIAKDQNGQIAAFTQLYPSFSSTRLKKTWILNDLYVHEDHRGKGISKTLINRAKDHAKATNAHGLMLETERDNTIANQLYVSTGFHRDQSHFYYWTVNK